MTREEAIERLGRFRIEIDALDRSLLEMFNARARIVEEIGATKRAVELPIYEPKREEEVFRNVIGHNRGPLSEGAVRRLFERIIDEMRTLQREMMQKESRQ